ncbi:MAG: TolC family protein [Polyangiaceae bacterium]|nr:TolC family protein [Polyangiaceae bacterium]
MARDTDPSYLHSAVGGGAGAGYAERVSVAADSEAGTDVTLAVILAYADRHSPVLSVARSTRSRAEAARVGASTLLPANPEVSVAVGPRVGAAGTGVDVDLGLMQQIQIAGERGLRVEVADRLRDLSDAEIGQMSWSVRCDVHEAFHRALFEQERARLAERVLGFQREVLRVVERQISAGEAAPFSLRLAQAEVAQAQQMLVAAQQAFVASRLRLAQLSGWPVATPPMPVGSVDSSRDPPSLARLSAMAGERLPSLRAGVARVREAEARAALADREVWPRPSVGVQYRREGGMGTEGTTHVMMGAVSFPIPAFQKNQGERAMARADIAVAEAELRAARHLLEGQIAEARSEVVAAAERTRAYGSDILPLFEENLTMLRRSFELGEIDILALSTGRERLFSIQSDAILAQQDYFVALARLERIIGVDLWREHHKEEGVP